MANPQRLQVLYANRMDADSTSRDSLASEPNYAAIVVSFLEGTVAVPQPSAPLTLCKNPAWVLYMCVSVAYGIETSHWQHWPYSLLSNGGNPRQNNMQLPATYDCIVTATCLPNFRLQRSTQMHRRRT